MKDFYKDLFEYNRHCNLLLSESFKTHRNRASLKSIQLFSHILDAHEIWNARIEGRTSLFTVWQEHSVERFETIIHENERNTNEIIDRVDLLSSVHYANNKIEKKVADILFHIINHSTYHRAQIATEFRQCGIEPIPTDYIHFRK